ncbi:hypothetical protein KXR87_19400, partial [Yokenella regensburgei]|uniref:hypothetical protein n=1 Tax=Yokenella regensburgei TaxID=158877 RepID=UPI003F15314F
RTALTSRPSACGRFDSPSWLDKPLSALPGGQSLSSGLRLAGFSGDSTPSLQASSLMKKGTAVAFLEKRNRRFF